MKYYTLNIYNDPICLYLKTYTHVHPCQNTKKKITVLVKTEKRLVKFVSNYLAQRFMRLYFFLLIKTWNIFLYVRDIIII